MTIYRIEWKRSALKELCGLPNPAIQAIQSAVEALSANPLPIGSRKLMGTEATFRIRRGNYRIVYSVFQQSLLVEIVRVGHRKDVYRQ